MTYQPVLPPYDHQREALERMRGKPAFALLMGMRTGKTKVLIDEWGEGVLTDRVQDLLVLAPAGVYKTWLAEIDKHAPPWLKERMTVGLWESSGDRSIPWQVVNQANGPRVLIVNIEALSSVQEARDLCVGFLRAGRATMCVDESTAIKSPKSERTKVTVNLGKLAPYRRILSGLPTPRSPLDLYSQFFFLDPQILGYTTYTRFKFRYAITRQMRVGYRMIPLVVGYQNVPELQEKIAPHSIRVRLEDCYDVPAKMYLTREVELTDVQKKLYHDLRRYATAHLEGGEYVTATEVVVQILRLHQLCCGHIVDEVGQYHEVETNRIGVLIDLLQEYDGKAVIWCSYRHDLDRISRCLVKTFGDGAVACFWGGNQATREEESRRFMEDDACRLMVATPGAGGRGRTWDVANLLVYYSNTDNLEHRDQSEERGSAVGKVDRVTVVDLVTRGTVEEKIIRALRKKIDLAAVVTGDAWREWIV
jgi:SNF2 family DNA or RNA helicase